MFLETLFLTICWHYHWIVQGSLCLVNNSEIAFCNVLHFRIKMQSSWLHNSKHIVIWWNTDLFSSKEIKNVRYVVIVYNYCLFICMHSQKNTIPNISNILLKLALMSLVAHRFGHVEFWIFFIFFFKCACLKKTTTNVWNSKFNTSKQRSTFFQFLV